MQYSMCVPVSIIQVYENLGLIYIVQLANSRGIDYFVNIEYVQY